MADAINNIKGVPVSDRARELSELWASVSISSAEMKRILVEVHSTNI